MPYSLATLLGKSVRYVARLRGGGSALPGLFVERIKPDFVSSILAQLPKGVVIISGTNGKTTTTKMVVELLESQGLKVFTNKTGSNFSRGVAAALLGEIDMQNNLNADIAVLELDEAHGAQFIKTVQPRYSLLLNVMRDQLDRFGEIDTTAKLLQKIAAATTGTVILNREDRRVASIKDSLVDQNVAYFGLSNSLRAMFPSDDDMHGRTSKHVHTEKADVELTKLNDDTATFTIDGKAITTSLKLNGVYNIFNVAAALTLVRSIMNDQLDQPALLKTLASITPAFGRGETIVVNGKPLELVLVKNPSGFRLGLESFDPDNYATMIAINDNYADGRDMSWLWDVDFESLRPNGVAEVSGIRAYDMALRLQYDDVTMINVDPHLSHALRHFIEIAADKPKRIYCTYTAMLSIRKDLSKIATVEVIS